MNAGLRILQLPKIAKCIAYQLVLLECEIHGQSRWRKARELPDVWPLLWTDGLLPFLMLAFQNTQLPLATKHCAEKLLLILGPLQGIFC